MGWSTFGRRVHGHDLGFRWLTMEITSRVAIAVAFILIRMIKPRSRSVWASEASQYAYPHKDDMISTKMMGVYMVISLGFLPPPLIALWRIKKWSPRQMADDALLFILGLSGGLLMTLSWIELGKRTISRYRPDFLSRCTGITNEVELSALVENMKGLGQLPCPSEADYKSTLLTDGRMSWPSGHSGTSFCVYVFLCCWFYLRLFPYSRLGFWKFAVPLMIAMFPSFVGITRILDYRHHWTDVLTGMIIGCFMGFISFRFYYTFEFPASFRPESADNFRERGNSVNDPIANHRAILINSTDDSPTLPGSAKVTSIPTIPMGNTQPSSLRTLEHGFTNPKLRQIMQYSDSNEIVDTPGSSSALLR